MIAFWICLGVLVLLGIVLLNMDDDYIDPVSDVYD